MNDNAQPLSPNKQALLKIRQLKQQLAAAQDCTGEPIAIVSMACRFPKASDTPEKFWQSLIQQQELVGEIPDARWDLEAFHDDDPEVPGTMYARKGVFLDNIDQMDPEFFGISPREATWVDPQQRLLMEVGYEAIERAGWIPEDIGDHTGVFVGWMHNDYQNEASDSFLNLNPYIATGAAGSFLCGRLAYYLGLQGPSVAVDTACSSSLVALHLAIQSLQRRDCGRALVGGVNAICSPTTNILTCKLKALSPNGHSRAFDAAADGYLRGEGCGVVTLRRLSDAESDGDSILGIIRGSAVGHNGFSSGLTAPNPKAQEKVILQALERAGVSPDEVGYLEAHGTGTELGDPIEVAAASAAYCKRRTHDNPLFIGSVKTNIGHLEAAAGMAGLIKVLLAMQNDAIPGQMNFENPNPHIPWNETPVKVLTTQTAWPDQDRRIAGVSAFGMSGTNAHVVVEYPQATRRIEPQLTQRQATKAATNRPHNAIITLSAKHEDALFELAAAYANSLAHDDSISIADFASTTNVARSHLELRAAIPTDSREQAIRLLRSLGRGNTVDPIFLGDRRRTPRVAWQFTGQGAQYVGMGRQLYDSQPVFRAAIDQCDQQLKSIRDGSLIDVLFNDVATQPALNNTYWTQPATFAVQMGLAQLLNSWNIQPDVVLGHSVGQYAAACVAGIMTWSDGLRLIAERGRLISELPHDGQMLAVFAPAEAVQKAITHAPGVSLAALNGTHVVISGDAAAISRIEQSFAERTVRTKQLNTSHAFHSHLMDPVLEPFAQFAADVRFHTATMPLVCNVSGQVLPTDKQLDGVYWADHIRQPVSFAPSIAALTELNCELLVELGPQSVLTRMAAANWNPPANTLVSCLQMERDDNHSLGVAIAQMYAQGITPDFAAMHIEKEWQRVDLPTYPFQRRRFWGPDKPRAAHAEHHTAHPLLGSKVSLAGLPDETRYEGFIDTDSPAWMPDHDVLNTTVLPGAALVEMALQAAGSRIIENVTFEQPIRPTTRMALQSVITKPDVADSGRLHFATYACPATSKNWNRHFACDFVDEQHQRPDPVDRQAIQDRLEETDSPDNFYQKMTSLGLNYGPAFRCIGELHFSDQQVLTHLQSSGDLRGYTIPPPLLDAALHSLAAGLLKSDDGTLFLPVGMARVECFAPIESEAWCVASWNHNEGTTRTADLVLFSESGEVLLRIDGLQVQQVSLAAMRQMSGSGAERLVHELQWKPIRLAATKLEPRNWLVISHDCEQDELQKVFVSQLVDNLREQHHNVSAITLRPDSDFDNEAENAFAFCGRLTANWKRLLDIFSNENSAPQIDGIAWVLGAANDHTESIVPYGVESVLQFVQAMLGRKWRRLPCGLQLITQNAIDTGEDQQLVQPQQTQFWGLGRVVGAEQPEFRCRLLDLCASEMADDNVAALAAEIALTETADNQHAIRRGQLLVPRMTQPKLAPSTGFSSRADGCYLVTGGLGKLGRQVARWLAEHGAQQIVLVSRRQPDKEALAFIESIEQSGCQVVIHAADVGDRDDVESLFGRFGDDLKNLAGVIHAAGVLDDGLLESQTNERFEQVLKPKVAGADLLNELTQDLEIDLFVLYSSAASVLGSPGQSNYATGNAYLDGLAYRRRQLGRPAITINWGPWTEGMADDERVVKRLAVQGITPLEGNDAHAALEQMLASNTVQATVMDVDWRRMRTGPNGDVPAILQELVGAGKKSRAADSALVSKLKQLRGNAQRELLVKTIQDSLQGILSTPDLPDTDRPLIEMGLDSLMAVEFGTELQQMLGDQFNFGPTMLFDHPTITAITDFVLDLVTSDDSNDSPTVNSQPAAPGPADESMVHSAREDIAVVGMSCRFPGARNLDEFWQNLLNGVDSVCDIPNDRWDIDRFYSADRKPGKMYTRRGGFLDDIADFDAAFFNISDQEACWIDPQHRMLLENSYRAMEDAGIPTSPLVDANVGVFMGIMGSDYAFLPTLDDEDIIMGFQGAGLSHSAGVGRISYLFGFEGPSVAVDTASSSSLVAVYQAMRSLQDGNCNLALAGGVNAILAPVNSLLMSKAGLLSPDGRCKSFSKSADGFGRGEGCGVVVLKRLSDAERDGDRVMAVLRGGAVVHNGFSGGITSPNGKAQSRVIDAAIKDARLAPSQIQYLEAHGTGTEYGDPIELGAAVTIYGKGRSKDNPLLVGSVKANISHLEAAGGASGLIKTVLAIHHAVIPTQVQFDEPSPHIPWTRMPVKMVSQTREWPQCERRTAGITALGLAGTNAHLVLSSPVETVETDLLATDSVEPNDRLLVVSARCENALHELSQRYLDYLETHPHTDLDDFCFTIGAGRRHFEHRMALPFNSLADVKGKLQQALRNYDPSVLRSQNGNGSAQNRTTGVKSTQNAGSPQLAWIFGDGFADIRTTLRELIATHPVIAKFVSECDQRLREHSTISGPTASEQTLSLAELITTQDTKHRHNDSLQYLLQASLAKLWQSWGIQPDAVAGYGVGQYTAASVAGCLCFLDAMVLVHERQTLLAGSLGDAEQNAFEKLADQFNYYPPNLPLICSLSGEVVPVHRSLGGSYWRQQATSEMQLEQSSQALIDLNCQIGLILGPMDESQLPFASGDNAGPVLIRACSRSKDSIDDSLLAILGQLYQQGCNPDFPAVLGNQRKLSLPTYPFQKKRYWITEISRFMEAEETPETKPIHS